MCPCCEKEKFLRDFYVSKSPLHAIDGKTPICKDCIIKYSLNESTNEVDEEKFKNILRQIDKPFYYDSLQSSINQFKKENPFIPEDEVRHHGDTIIRYYMKNAVSLKQLSRKNYADSEKDGFIQPNSTVVQKEIATTYKKNLKEKLDNEVVTLDLDENFEVTPEIVNMFGEGYTRLEYKKMYKKYETLKINYTLQTNLHQEALATYVRFKVKEEDATARGNVDEAKKWYDAAQNAAMNGKLTPKSLSAADLDKGMNSVCELIKAVEQATDVIKILPQFKYRPNDSPDFTIMCYVNYERELNGQPQVSYEDIYSFYDKKVKEYVDQNGDPYGIFKNDPSKKNRDTVKTFLKMPDDYEELSGDEDGN